MTIRLITTYLTKHDIELKNTPDKLFLTRILEQ